MGIFREGISESSVDSTTIKAKPSIFSFLFRAHTKVTGTSVAPDKFALDVALADIDPSNPLPVEDAGDRNEFFLETTVVSDGTVQTALTYTVLAAETMRFNNLLASSGAQILCKIYKNGILIGTTRSGAANKQATFRSEPNRTLNTGDILLITVQDINGGPLFGNDIDVFFQGRKY
jgi:hypothetical protein